MPTTTTARAVGWVEQGLVPDRVVRLGIRRLLKERLAEMHAGDAEAAQEAEQAFVEALPGAPVALLPEKANEQHYEVPADFFARVLGPHRKYSCCWWGEGVQTLEQAEAAALALTCQRADLRNRIRVGVIAADVEAFPEQIHEIAAAAASGIEHAHARGDASAQQLIEHVDVDVAELVLQGHRPSPGGTQTCWPIAQTSWKPRAR